MNEPVSRPFAKPPNDRLIVVAGGYGAVGGVVTATLAAALPGRVVVAGRDAAKAAALMRATPGVLSARRVDTAHHADTGAMLAGASVLVMCVEQGNQDVARACLERGIHYVDVSASWPVLHGIAGLDMLARRSGAAAALSVGLAPGITNLLARHCADRLPGATSMDLTILIGLGGDHGADSVRWTVDNLAARPLARPARVALPGFGTRTAYQFPFSDQISLRETLGIPTTTRICFDSAPLTAAVFALRRAGLFRLFRGPRFRRLLVWAFTRRRRAGKDSFAVVATARDGLGGEERAAVTGNAEARITGVVAARVAGLLHSGAVPAGVRHLDQFVDPGSFLSGLGDEISVRLAG